MTETMRAIVLDAPGPPDALTIRALPIPTPATGWVLIEVKAFGLNRSELHTRQGLSSGVTFPRVLGIEAAAVVAQCPGREFPPEARSRRSAADAGCSLDARHWNPLSGDSSRT